MDNVKNMLKEIGIEEQEKVDKIINFLKTEVPKEWIPNWKYNKVKEELNLLETQSKENIEKLEALSKLEADNNTLKEHVKEMKAENESVKVEAEKRVLNMTKSSKVKEMLEKNGVVKDAVDLLVGGLDIDSIMIDQSGNVVDSDIIVNKFKSERPNLFVTETVKSVETKEGSTPAQGYIEDDEIWFETVGKNLSKDSDKGQ